MAHADYECCAICDSKMAFSHNAESKEHICADCAVAFYAATGERVTTGAELAAWIQRTGAPAVDILRVLGFSECPYGNEVDDAFHAATPTHGGER